MRPSKITVVSRVSIDTTEIKRGLGCAAYEMTQHVCDGDGKTAAAVRGADLVFCYGLAMPRLVIEAMAGAVAVVSMGHAFDRIDVGAATEHGVMVVNTPGFCTEEVANQTMALMLACSKRIVQLNNLVKAGRWGEDTTEVSANMPRIDGQVLGLIGLGNIARNVARKALAFGMEIVAYDPYVHPWLAREYRVELLPTVQVIADRSDYVSTHVPLNTVTGNMIGSDFFRRMKPTAYFINTGRGGTVDEEALAAAVAEREIAGAGIDVFREEPTPKDNPLLGLDNVIVTPHTASAEASVAYGQRALGEEAARIIAGTWPMALVNPEVRSRVPKRADARNG